MPSHEGGGNPLFYQLVLSLQSAAWYQMGKTMSPITGKIERNLNEARVSIDLLTMLQEKTRGNLLEEEKKILDNAVFTLQMNYIDEVNLDKEKAAAPISDTGGESSSAETGASDRKDPSLDIPEDK